MGLNLRTPINLEARKTTNLSGFVTFVVELGILDQIASKQAFKQKVSVSKAQDHVVLIYELVKILNLYTNTRAKMRVNSNRNANFKFASKKVWMQKTQPQ